MSPKLSAILAAHRGDHGPGTLRRNLGDAHLFRVNPVFRTIRSFARKNGYSFRSDDSRYAGGALFSLDRILKEKSIPYFDNVTGLVEIERARPDFFRVRDFEPIGPRYNAVFHESCHALCHEVINLGDPRALRGRGYEALLRIIVAESIVMATEQLACTYVANDGVSRYLFNSNFYVKSRRGGDANVRVLLRKHGVARGYALLALACLFSWSYVERLDRADLASMLEHARIENTPAARKDAALAYRHFFRPRGPVSRTLLMDFYLLSRGYSRTVGESGYLDFAEALRSYPHIAERMARLGELVTADLS